MIRRLIPAFALTAIIVSTALADLPTQVTPEQAPQLLDATDFALAVPVERTGETAEVLVLFTEGADTSHDFTALRVTGDGTEIITVRGGAATVVGRTNHGLIPVGRSSDLTVHRRGAHLVVGAGDRALAHFLSEDLPVERVGASSVGATLGDMLVQPLGDVTFDEDFFATKQVADRWETLRGAWEVGIYWDPLQERDNRPIGASWYEPAEGDCLTAAGYDIFDSYRLGATVRLPEGRGGLAFHVRGPDDYCAFEVGEDAARLVRVAKGERRVLAEAPADLRPDWSYRLRVDVSTGHARCFINDRPLVEAGLSPALTGRIGLIAHNAPGSRFDDITARRYLATHIPPDATAQQAFVFDDGT